MAPLIHCIYRSTARRGFAAAELAELLRQSRENNARLGLTGMLLHVDGNFFQVLEGAPHVVDAKLAKIETDSRHGNLTTIIREPIPQRFFGEWTMGFATATDGELSALASANDFFDAGACIAALDAGRAKKLLTAFGDGRWRNQLGSSPGARRN